VRSELRVVRRREFLTQGSRAALGLWLAPATPQTRSWRSAIDDLEKQIAELMPRHAVPGASVAAIRDATIVWQRGFGIADVVTKAPVTPETIFGAGSMSKPVFAYAVMQLSDTGVINLDTPLTKYTTERVVKDDPRLDLITARHVLSHTSGFQNWRTDAEPLRIHFTPGQRFLYSGEGYSYLQSVVTRLTGHVDRRACAKYEAGLEVCATDIDAHMKSHLLEPFGMKSASYVWNRALEPRLARRHGTSGQPLDRIRPTATDAARYAAAGALLITPADYAKFVIEVIASKEDRPFRLRKTTVAEMLRPQVKTNDEFSSSWALGWQVQQSGVINHGGDNTGFHAHAVASVENRSGFVIMTNGDRGGSLIASILTGDAVRRIL
jgi:CubicO group peptidase (beta-lactamase class C family)